MAHGGRVAHVLPVGLAAALCLLGGLAVGPAAAPVARRALAAATLHGIVYVAGGWNGEATQLDRVDAYDPIERAWRPVPALAIARSQHSLVAALGRLWVVAGWSAEGGLVAEIETWKPGEATWRTVTRVPTPRREPGVALLGNRIVVAGGFNGSSDADLDGYSGVVEAYDLASGAWASLASMPTPRRGLALVNVNDALYALGGYNAWDGFLGVVERYDPDRDAWQRLDWSIAPRTWAAGLADAEAIVLIGGFDGSGPLARVERIDALTGKGCDLAPLRVARSWLAAAPLGGRRALTVGGETRSGFSDAVEVIALGDPDRAGYPDLCAIARYQP
ncbi:MAG: kelch repeat-containing protein [Thermoflexales bacterium]